MRTVFDKMRKFKEVVKVMFPHILEKDLRIMVDHITRVEDGVRKHLSEGAGVLSGVRSCFSGFSEKEGALEEGCRVWCDFVVYGVVVGGDFFGCSRAN
ncbi:MAG: hypothetical protein QGH47_07190 [Candidatus Woesearchaeota archaeon]|nr:hypothetical protein [Candidatus Woesearchaeota archaeon]